jgi:hypothetical protein
VRPGLEASPPSFEWSVAFAVTAAREALALVRSASVRPVPRGGRRSAAGTGGDRCSGLASNLHPCSGYVSHLKEALMGMKKNYGFTAFLLPVAALALTGCEIEQEEQGELPDTDVSYQEGELPEYEVEQTQEGEMPDVDVDTEGGNLPEYDVEGPDVDVGTEEKTIEVPDVDVTMPDEQEAGEGADTEDDR